MKEFERRGRAQTSVSGVDYTRQRKTYEEDECRPTDTPPSCEWLHSRGKRKRLPVDSLCFHALVKPEVGYSNAEPCDQPSSGGKVGEPGKDSAGGTVPERHVSEERKARTDSDGDVRHPRARCAHEDLWRTTRDSQTV